MREFVPTRSALSSRDEFPTLGAAPKSTGKKEPKLLQQPSAAASNTPTKQEIEARIHALDLSSRLKLQRLQDAFANVPTVKLLDIFVQNRNNYDATVDQVLTAIPDAEYM